MLRGLAADFTSAGHSVTVLLDARIAAFQSPLSAEHIVEVSCGSKTDQLFKLAVENADAVYIIAPEPNHVLPSIVAHIETTGALSLNCTASAIEAVSDKTHVADAAKRLGLNFPVTLNFTKTDPYKHIVETIHSKLSYPIVLKPSSSAGCGGLSLVQNTDDLALAISKAQTESNSFVAQPFIKGTTASVSLLSTGKTAMPISFNLQDLTLATPNGVSCYNGGTVPLEHPLKQQALAAAKQLTEQFAGLRGYVGVDVVLGDDGAVWVMEINPRLTTSFVGLRRVLGFNVADALLSAVTKQQLPSLVEPEGACCFVKCPVPVPSLAEFAKICADPAVTAPPFPLNNTDRSCALLEATAPTTQQATEALLQAKKRLQHNTTGGKVCG